MIDIFKSGSGKKIIAIDEDAGIAAIHAVGRILLIGTDGAISQLQAALAVEQSPKMRLLTSAEKAEILKLSAEGLRSSEIAAMLRLNGKQVHGIIQADRYPILDNIAKKARREATQMSDEDRIDKIIAEGRKAGHSFVQVADDINRIVGGHWLPNDVHRRIMEKA